LPRSGAVPDDELELLVKRYQRGGVVEHMRLADDLVSRGVDKSLGARSQIGESKGNVKANAKTLRPE